MFSTVWDKFGLFKSLQPSQRCQHTSQISIHMADSIAGWLAELRAECWSQFSRSDYRAQLIVSVCVYIIQRWFCVSVIWMAHILQTEL